MNWLKQLVRIGLTKCANKQRRALVRTRGLAPVQNKFQNHRQPFVDNLTNFTYPLQTFTLFAPTLKEAQKRRGESHGLLDLVTNKRGIEGRMDMGDFAAVTQENFAHALHFSKAEIDYGSFSIDELETVCSQSVDDASMTGENNNKNEVNYLEESEGSNISYTETDIFIELPNSEVIERVKQKGKSTNDSAPF